MYLRLSPIRIPTWLVAALLGLALAASLHACTPAVESIPAPSATPSHTVPPTPSALPATSTLQPSSTPTRTLTPATPTATPTPTYEYIPSPYPTSIEAFGLQYDPNATLNLPPWGSISMLFWGPGIPVQPYLSTPEFIAYPTPQPPPGSSDLLAQAGCHSGTYWGEVDCSPESPLLRFDCESIVDPGSTGWGLQPYIPLVAVCWKETEEHEAAKAGGFYIVGCAFKRTIHYIFDIDGEYTLLSSVGELTDLFAPIESPEEAVSFTQLATGMDAMYAFSYDPYLMYFHETIEGTRVTQAGSAFDVILFNFAGCGCEPSFTTRINIRVDRSGQVTWQDAVPIFMTTGWSCAD